MKEFQGYHKCSLDSHFILQKKLSESSNKSNRYYIPHFNAVKNSKKPICVARCWSNVSCCKRLQDGSSTLEEQSLNLVFLNAGSCHSSRHVGTQVPSTLWSAISYPGHPRFCVPLYWTSRRAKNMNDWVSVRDSGGGSVCILHSRGIGWKFVMWPHLWGTLGNTVYQLSSLCLIRSLF